MRRCARARTQAESNEAEAARVTSDNKTVSRERQPSRSIEQTRRVTHGGIVVVAAEDVRDS